MEQTYDAIIVLGRNWKGYPGKPEIKDGKVHLSLESKMSSLAALMMYEKGLTKKIILCSGKTAGQNFPSEAGAMAEFMRKRSPIPKEAIILEEESLETYGNMENTKALLDKYNLADGKLALVTVGLHLPRSVNICNFYGLKVDAYPSEEKVKQISEHHKATVERYEKSCFVKRERLREFLLRRIQLINPSGNIPRILGEYMRK